jgi:hypothetical protein
MYSRRRCRHTNMRIIGDIMHTVRPSHFSIYVEGLLGIGARQLIPLIQVKAHIGVRTMNKMHTIRK